MREVDLPISKSIANRVLIIQAMHDWPLFDVCGDNVPDDVVLLREALTSIRCVQSLSSVQSEGECRLNLKNCGTAMRFLTAYCAQREGLEVVLDGSPRMRERPILQLVDALAQMGADIRYEGEYGFPPLRIRGRALTPPSVHCEPCIVNPRSTQFVSALMLIGVDVKTNVRSPYIEMTRALIQRAQTSTLFGDGTGTDSCEVDWSSAAFWYEYVALHGGEMLLRGLKPDSLQGDRVVADIYRKLGVRTEFTAQGVVIRKERDANRCLLFHNFRTCPDLYPAVAVTCRQLGIRLLAIGTKTLRWKESDRIKSVRECRTNHDHRIAMALLAAGLPCDDTECVSKSYPTFVEQLSTSIAKQSTTTSTSTTTCIVNRIIPRRGINDEGKGKKFALHKLIGAATTEYVWLQDDDVRMDEWELPATATLTADLYILPLRMRAEGREANLIERLQIAEYAAIQQLTMEAARRGHAVMCSGANLIVKRDRWLESYADLHPEIPSGDDMFLLESFKRRGLTIEVMDEERITAYVAPLPTWSALIKQRMRWAGKAPKYSDKDIIRCGAIVLLANLIQIAVPAIMLVKFPIEYTLIKKRDASVSLWVALLLEIVYPYYMLICLIGGFFRRQW